MNDPTESFRRTAVAAINRVPGCREDLETKYGQVWSTGELTQDFEILGFMAPYVVVRRKSDKVRGTLTFQHGPRFYFDFQGE
jgi:hypothetical protein